MPEYGRPWRSSVAANRKKPGFCHVAPAAATANRPGHRRITVCGARCPLSSPGGAAMAVSPIPEGYHTVNAYLIVDDAARAIDFYTGRLRREGTLPPARSGARRRASGSATPRSASAIRNLMLCDEWPDMGALGPKAARRRDDELRDLRARLRRRLRRRRSRPVRRSTSRSPISSGATAWARWSIPSATSGRWARIRKMSRPKNSPRA